MVSSSSLSPLAETEQQLAMAPKVNRHHHQQQHDIGVLGYEDNNPPSSPSSERPPEYYEDAGVNIGAPTEMISPLGYHVDSISVVFLNVGKIIGTGVFSTRMDYCALSFSHSPMKS